MEATKEEERMLLEEESGGCASEEGKSLAGRWEVEAIWE